MIGLSQGLMALITSVFSQVALQRALSHSSELSLAVASDDETAGEPLPAGRAGHEDFRKEPRAVSAPVQNGRTVCAPQAPVLLLCVSRRISVCMSSLVPVPFFASDSER